MNQGKTSHLCPCHVREHWLLQDDHPAAGFQICGHWRTSAQQNRDQVLSNCLQNFIHTCTYCDEIWLRYSHSIGSTHCTHISTCACTSTAGRTFKQDLQPSTQKADTTRKADGHLHTNIRKTQKHDNRTRRLAECLAESDRLTN